MLRAIAFIALTVALASSASADPSFDCEKAESDVEYLLCHDDGPASGGGGAWLDRQLAHLYVIAKKRVPEKRAWLVASQRRFLKDRDACSKRRGCRFEDTYRKRLKAVARAMNDERAFQVFRGAGQLQIARYGTTASLSISSVGGNDHICQFEQDDLPLGEDGVVRFYDEELAFRIVVAPVGNALQVATEGHAHCGARASMDGLYTRVP